MAERKFRFRELKKKGQNDLQLIMCSVPSYLLSEVK